MGMPRAAKVVVVGHAGRQGQLPAQSRAAGWQGTGGKCSFAAWAHPGHLVNNPVMHRQSRVLAIEQARPGMVAVSTSCLTCSKPLRPAARPSSSMLLNTAAVTLLSSQSCEYK